MSDDNSHSSSGVPPAIRPRKLPNQERSQITVEALLDALARILVDAPETATTNAVAALAGVSVGSLYQYFPNIDAIVASLLRRQARAEAAFVLECMAAAKPRDLRAALEVAIDAAFAFRGQNPKLQRALLEQLDRIPQFPALIEEARDAALGLGQLLSAFQSEIKRPDAALAIHVVCNAAFSLTHRGLFPRPPATDDAAYKREIVTLLTAYLQSAG
ncbi:MAG: TetR/AcrR family transcriptional regulator [Myxococcota bacterium]